MRKRRKAPPNRENRKLARFLDFRVEIPPHDYSSNYDSTGSMGAASYIVRGLGNPDSFESCSHGAGRRMSRIAACTTLTPEQCDAALDGIVYERWHPYRKFGKAKGRLDLSEAPQAYKDIEDVIRS